MKPLFSIIILSLGNEHTKMFYKIKIRKIELKNITIITINLRTCMQLSRSEKDKEQN